MIDFTGEHADDQLKHDAPLKCDMSGVGAPETDCFRVALDSHAVARDGAETIRAARAPKDQIAAQVSSANTVREAREAQVDSFHPADLHGPGTDQIAAAAEAVRRLGRF